MKQINDATEAKTLGIFSLLSQIRLRATQGSDSEGGKGGGQGPPPLLFFFFLVFLVFNCTVFRMVLCTKSLWSLYSEALTFGHNCSQITVKQNSHECEFFMRWWWGPDGVGSCALATISPSPSFWIRPCNQPKDRANGKVLLTLTDTLQKHTNLRWTRKVVHISSFIKIVIHGFSSGRRGSGTQTCKTIVTFESRRSHNIQINCFVAGSESSGSLTSDWSTWEAMEPRILLSNDF